MHLTHRNEQSELHVVNIEFEEGSSTYDLQSRKDDLPYVHVTNEDVSGDFSYILEKAEIEGFILEPRNLQITVDVSTVGIPVSKIPVMVVFVGRHGKTAICSDADCNTKANIFNIKQIELIKGRDLLTY